MDVLRDENEEKGVFKSRSGFVSYPPRFIKAGSTFIHTPPVIITLSHGN